MKKIRLTKKRLYMVAAIAIFMGGLPVVFKFVQVSEEVTMKVLEFCAMLFGGTIGGVFLGSALTKDQQPPPNG